MRNPGFWRLRKEEEGTCINNNGAQEDGGGGMYCLLYELYILYI